MPGLSDKLEKPLKSYSNIITRQQKIKTKNFFSHFFYREMIFKNPEPIGYKNNKNEIFIVLVSIQ